jgi:hypothetical protein
MSSQQAAPRAAPAALSVTQALLALVAVVVALAAYLTLFYALGLHETYVGFLFLFFWAAVQHFDMAALPATATGSFVGLGLGYVFQQLSAHFGVAGGAAFGLGTLVVLYLLLRRQLRLFINDAAMLMLTVATISHIQSHADFRDLFASLALSVALFGGAVWLVGRMRRKEVGAPPVQA